VRSWLDCGVHVQGRPEWLFVKLHTHGAVERDFDALFGDKAFEMHRTLNEMCNDGRRYQLHYVTARQAYNLAKAAERGLGGDPNQWLDLVVDKPATAYYALPQQHDLGACTARRLRLSGIDAAGGDATLSTTVGALSVSESAVSVIPSTPVMSPSLTSVPGGSGVEPSSAGEPASTPPSPASVVPASCPASTTPASTPASTPGAEPSGWSSSHREVASKRICAAAAVLNH
jgi:hypothetical protein